MKVLELRAENFKRLVAVDISPDGDVIQITGRNGAGKSSVLDAIAYAIGGRDLIPAEPVRNGAKQASVAIKLGDDTEAKYLLTRRSTLKSNYLELTAKDGVPLASPQAILDKLFGSLTFDPLAFTRMKASEQRDVLLRLTGLGDKLAAIDKARQAAFDERTIVGRNQRQLEGQIAGLPPVTIPPEPKPVGDLTAALNAAHATNRSNAAERQKIASLEAAVKNDTANVERQEKVIADLEAQLTNARKLVADLIRTRGQSWLALEPARKLAAALSDEPTADIERQIAESQSATVAYTSALAASGKRDEVKYALAKANGAAEELTAKIESCDKEKESMIAAAKWPIDGLGFSAAGVAYGGVPFEQASSSEQLRVSLAIGMALNPTLKVLLIRDGSLLDTNAMQIVSSMSADKGYQVWIERVDETGKVGIVIEEGQVKE